MTPEQDTQGTYVIVKDPCFTRHAVKIGPRPIIKMPNINQFKPVTELTVEHAQKEQK